MPDYPVVLRKEHFDALIPEITGNNDWHLISKILIGSNPSKAFSASWPDVRTLAAS